MQKMRMELGRRIRELRKLHGWSQEELGERADLHPTYVGGIERGERNVAFENLCRLSAAFKLTLSQFFDFPGRGQTDRDQLKAQLISLLQNRDENDIEMLIAIIGVLDHWKERNI